MKWNVYVSAGRKVALSYYTGFVSLSLAIKSARETSFFFLRTDFELQ